MRNSKSLLLYQDVPEYGALLKLIIVILPGGLLAASAFVLSSGDSSSGLALLAEAFIIGLIFWAIFPRSYQIYEGYLRIVLGGPFAVNIKFEHIKNIEVTSKTALTVNFVTRLAKTYVKITRKNGLSIAITPKSNNLFVNSAMQALRQWAITREAAGR